MTDAMVYFDSFDSELDIPDDAILSRTLLDTPGLRLVLFRFAAGQELSEHTASVPAVIQIISGEARLTLGDTTHDASAGAFAYMPANLPHAIYAKSPLTMLLQMHKLQTTMPDATDA